MSAEQRLEIKIIWLGVGQMGKALIRRLVQSAALPDLSLHIWNRSIEPLQSFISQEFPSNPRVFHADSIASVFQSASAAPLAPTVICTMLSNYEVTRTVLSDPNLQSFFQPESPLSRAPLLCLSSGTPDQARTFAGDMRALRPLAEYLDGCFVGSPHAVRDGRGTLLFSSPEDYSNEKEKVIDASPAEIDASKENPRVDPEMRRIIPRLLSTLSPRLIYCGAHYGSCKALDYALVDHYFLNYLSLVHALSITEKEGIPRAQLLGALSAHAQTFPVAWERMADKMDARQYGNDSASLDVWREFFAHRFSYLDNAGIPKIVPEFATRLIDQATESSQEASLDDDLIRLQDLFRK